MQCSFLILLIIPYFLLISAFIVGWYLTVKDRHAVDSPGIVVTILIPLRNEEASVQTLSESLKKQAYPREKLEILFIDDHSTDNTIEKIQESGMLEGENKLLRLTGPAQGKKEALWMGIQAARGEFILMTDADCRHHPSWVNTMTQHYLKFPGCLITGPVFVEEKIGFWINFQNLEFLSLVASGAGSAGINHPILCNGANLGIGKEILKRQSKVYHSRISSGDDIFLLQALKRIGVKAKFVPVKEASVITQSVGNLKDYVHQRSRWTFKSKFYKDFDIIVSAVIVLITNLFLLLLPVLIIFHLACWMDFIMVILAKSIIDFILLFMVAKKFDRMHWLKYFPLHQIIYIIYVSVIGIIGHFSTFSWKSRSIK